MLILSRKVEEGVRIGGDVTVRVLEIRGGKVRLGFEAPDGVKILRDELADDQAATIRTTKPDGGAAA